MRAAISHRLTRFCLFVLACGGSVLGAPVEAGDPGSQQRALQARLDATPTNGVLRCDPNEYLTLAGPVTIRRPLTLTGLRARLPEKLGHTSLLVVEAKGVAVTDFELTGNGDSVSQEERAPLIVIRAGEFRVERGSFVNSSKDGVMIEAGGTNGEDIVGGVIRDVVGRDVIRDTVSISGGSGEGRKVRNILVDTVRCYNSRLRGAVEVSDGSESITVRKVYAESAIYAVDVQDHGKSNQANRNVVIEDIHAVRCRHALRTANSRQGHANLTIRDVVAEACAIPIQISHTENVMLAGVRVLDHDGKSPLQISDCRGVTVRDVVFQNVTVKGAALWLQNCQETVVDALTVRGQTNQLENAVQFRLNRPGEFSGLRISRVLARDTTGPGILLESAKETGFLSHYVISENLATVRDEIRGRAAVVTNNLHSAR